MSFRSVICGALAAAVFATGASASIIDDFSSATATVDAGVVSNPFNRNADAEIDTGFGVAFFDYGTMVIAEPSLSWDFTGSPIDITGMDQLVLDFLFVDQSPLLASVTINGNSLQYVVDSTTEVIDVSSIMPGDGLLDTLVLTFNLDPAVGDRVASIDFALDTVSIVPEPASAALAAAGLGLMLLRRRA